MAQFILVSRGILCIDKNIDKQSNNYYHTELHIQSYDYIESKESNEIDGTLVTLKEKTSENNNKNLEKRQIKAYY